MPAEQLMNPEVPGRTRSFLAAFSSCGSHGPEVLTEEKVGPFLTDLQEVRPCICFHSSLYI